MADGAFWVDSHWHPDYWSETYWASDVAVPLLELDPGDTVVAPLRGATLRADGRRIA